jgi:hypothetical protein
MFALLEAVKQEDLTQWAAKTLPPVHLYDQADQSCFLDDDLARWFMCPASRFGAQVVEHVWNAGMEVRSRAFPSLPF